MIRSLSFVTLTMLVATTALAQPGGPPSVTFPGLSPAFQLPGPAVTPGTPFVEDFEDGPSGFGSSEDGTGGDSDPDNSDVFTGPGGVGGSNQLLLVTSLDVTEAFQGVLFRAEAALGSSGGAFAGNFIEAGVDEFSFTIQHDAPVDLSFALRFAPIPANFPGGFAVGFEDVEPNVPTELSIQISPDNLFNPAAFQFDGLGFFEVPTIDPLEQFNFIFSAVGNIQFTVELPEGFAAVTQEDIDNSAAPATASLGDVFAIDNAGAFIGAALFNTADEITFGLDNVTLTAVPEPSAGTLFAIAGLAGSARRRR